MIYIHRNIPEPNSITNDADQEHNDAEVFYSVACEKFKAFEHKVFKRLDVKKALEKQFSGKCAYCESKVVTTSAIDKEHFRPKASIVDKDKNVEIKPGYYWLAASWENLLLACAHCNRTGTFEDSEGEYFVSGKLDRFPLSDETRRYYRGGNFEEEERVRLLINPCVDNPEPWIEYDDLGMIFPKDGIAEFDKEKVKKSIEIFGLYRNDLSSSRLEKLLTLLDVIQNLYDNYDDYLRGGNTNQYLKRIERNFESLRRIKSKDKEYLGIKRFFIRKELKKLKDIIRLLNSAE